jgi:O-antigen/teichoic acid export membrane protein
MDERARLRRDVAWNLVPIALLGAVGIGMQFAIAGWWGPEALAVFELVRIVMFVTAVLGAFGLQYATLRAIAAAPDERGAIFIGALVPAIGLAAVVTAAVVALRGPIGRLVDSDSVAEGLLWVAPGLFCFCINKLLLNVVNGLRRMRAYAVYTSMRYTLIAIGLLLAHALDVSAAHLSGLWTFVEGVMLLVLATETIRQVPLQPGWRAWTRRHLEYGARGVTSTLAAEVNTKLDVWMLGAFHLDKALVGYYVLAATLNEGAQQLGVVVANNLNPILARDIAAGATREVEALARRTRRWFVPLLAGSCVLAAVAFPVIVPRVLGADYIAGAAPFAILVGGLAAASPWLPFTQILLMANRPGWHTFLVVCVVVVNFGLDLVLIPPLGPNGAAIATACAVMTSALLVRAFARARVGAKI